MFIHPEDKYDPDFSVNRCNDAAVSTYSFALLFVGISCLSIFVFPFELHLYTVDDIIKFNMHLKHQILCLGFVLTIVLDLFLFASHKGVLEDYDAYRYVQVRRKRIKYLSRSF